MTRFALTAAPIDTLAARNALADPAAGGFAAFEGWVRDHNDGRQVLRLEYEAFEALACDEGDRIVAEAIARHGLRAACCLHRTGPLGIGELAVWVGAAAAHRAEAFAACRYIIDEVKHRVPIWKKEHYADGDSGWVNCARCADPHAHADADADAHTHTHTHGEHRSGADYSRQTVLREVGAAGQARLAAARVLVVGAGGLGCPVLAYLAGAGVGTLGICDADRIEASNLHRQPLYRQADVGQAKAVVAAERVTALNGDVHAVPHLLALGPDNAAELLAGYDLVVDCSDNFATKFAVNDAAVRAGKPAVLASVHQYEGQLQVVRADAAGACLRCVWPEATPDGLVGNCAGSGVLGPVPGLFGSLQAMEVLKLLLDLPGQLRDEVLLLDLLGLEQRRLRAPRRAECGAGPCRRLPAAAPDLELALAPAAAAAAGYVLVDIRDPAEVAAQPVPGATAVAIPLKQLLADPARLARGPRYALVCARGLRSRTAAERLRAAGIEAFSLRGGIAGVGV